MKKLLLCTLAVSALSAWGETPPCSFMITDQEAFEQWTVEDANADGENYLWKYGDGYALYTQNTSKAADDWLFSPAVTFTAGVTYDITGWVRNATKYASYDKQAFTFYVCEAPNSTATKTEICKETSLAGLTYYKDYSGKFTAPADGEYYLAIQLTSKAFQGNCEFKGFDVKEVVALPGAVADLAITPGDQGALSANLSWTWGTTNDQGGPAVAVTGANIYRSTNSSMTATATYLVGTMEVEDGQAGAAASWTDNTVGEAGKYYYMVVPFNEKGASTATPSKVQSAWIGPDKPGAVSNVVATPVEDNDKAISLTFDMPTASNGGYLDLNAVSYKITRTAGTASAVTVADNWQGELPYVDDTLPGLNSYVYTVYTIYDGTTSWSGVKSNAVVTGGALSIPYTNSFSSSTDIQFFTLLNEGNGTRNWGISSSALDYWGSGSAVDVWAITPYLEMEAGKAYKMSFTERVTKSTDPKPLSIYLGDAPESQAMTTQLYDTTVASQYATARSVIFGVPADGIYCIGFRVNGNITGSNDIYVDDLKIEEVIVTPSAATDFTATAAAEGALAADLKWTNPTTTNAGTELGDITAIEVRRGSELIATLEEAVPGAEMTYTDRELSEAGVYTYSVTVVLGEQSSPAVSATTAWVGTDTPKAPAEVNVALDEDGNRTITWTAVTEGVNGGYVDAEAVRYEVSRDDTQLADDVAETTYTDSEDDLALAAYTYYVKAYVGELASTATASPSVVIGDAIALPYNPDFSNADDFMLWTMVNPVNEGKNWKFSSGKGLEASFVNAGAWAITPPFKAKQGTCKVTYKATCYSARYSEKLELYLLNNTEDLDNATKIADYDVTSVSYPNAVTNEFSIPKDGTYHIGFKVVTPDQWTATLKQCDIAQLTETGVFDITVADGMHYADGVFGFDGTLSIYNLQGLLVATANDGTLNVNSLTAGVYVAKHVDIEGKVSTFKFAK